MTDGAGEMTPDDNSGTAKTPDNPLDKETAAADGADTADGHLETTHDVDMAGDEAADDANAGAANTDVAPSSQPATPSASPKLTAGSRRSPRIANRVENPRVLLRKWLDEDKAKRTPRPRSLSSLSHSPHDATPASASDAAKSVAAKHTSVTANCEEDHSSSDVVESGVSVNSDSDAEADDDSDDDFEPRPPKSRSKPKSARDKKQLKQFNKLFSDEEDDEAKREDESREEAESDEEDKSSGDSSVRDTDSTMTFGHAPVEYVEALDEYIDVPDVKLVHKSWKKLYKYVERYARETHQAIRTSNTVHVNLRNAEIRKTKAGREGSADFVPKKWDKYKRIFICTHGWQPRDRTRDSKKGHDKKGKKAKKDNSAPKRNMRWIRFTNCPFRFTAIVKRVAGKWSIVICNACLRHNHRVGSKEAKTLAENRGIRDPDKRVRAEAMIENKRKPREILCDMLARGENLILRDAQNMSQAFKNEVKREDDDQACFNILENFIESQDRAVASIDETQHKETGVVSLTSAFMSNIVSRFGEMLLVDCTHKTNRYAQYNYQLMTLMVVDDHGKGQVAKHSLLERNADWHMSRALDHFVRAHPDLAEKVEVIMVDKDLNEIKVLKMYFPNARILICLFHVLKYLAQMIRKPDFGKISTDDRETLEAIVHGMRVCQANDYLKFFDYFETNWHTCTDMWVMYTRARLPHFRVHTNNHLESFFGHLKSAVTPVMGMAETVKALIDDDRVRENDYTHRRTRVGRYYNKTYDDDMNELLKFTNPFVAESVKTEYALALEKFGVFKYDDSLTGGTVSVTGKTKTHDVDIRTWKCSCSFSHSMKLPCQHAIALRKAKQFEVSIPMKAVGNRWLGPAEVKATVAEPRVLYTPFNSGSKKCKLSSRDKYREATRATEALRSELADISDDDEFHAHLEFVLDQWRRVRQRRLDDKDEDRGDNTHAHDHSIDNPEQSHGDLGMSQPPSQAHSLFSEELGNVRLVAPAPVPVTGDLIVSSQVDEDREDFDSDFVQPVKMLPRLTFNPRAAKSGRPRRVMGEVQAEQRDSRARTKAAQEVWKTLEEPTLTGLVALLEEKKPGIVETAAQLTSLRERHVDIGPRAKARFSVENAPVVSNTCFYLLEEHVLDLCFEVLPVANKVNEAIVVSSQSDASQSQGDPGATGPCMDRMGKRMGTECVSITGAGKLTRATIEAMRYLSKLKKDCKEGASLCSWLTTTVSDFLFDGRPAKIAAELEAVYPYAKMPGFRHDYAYEELYRIPNRWVSDALISAFCEQVMSDCGNAKFIEIVSRVKKTARASKERLPDSTTTKITAAALDAAVDVMIIPVNFADEHWTLVLVHKSKQEIIYYDSSNQKPYLNTLGDFTQDVGTLMYSLFGKGFKNMATVTPHQLDGHSFGIFVCHKIATTLDYMDSDNILTETGATNFRFRLLVYVLHGEKI